MRTVLRRGSSTRPLQAIGTAIAVVLVAGACTSGDPGSANHRPETIELGNIELIASLQRFDSCDAFLADVKAEALERVGPYGLEGPTWMIPLGRAEASQMDDSGAPPPSDSASGTTDFTGTNRQEAGVDEPDLVKTDGRLLATVSGSLLHLIDVSDPANPVTFSTSPLAGWGAELLLHGDRLLVFQQVGQGWTEPGHPDRSGDIGVPADSPTVEAGSSGTSSRIMPGPYWPYEELTTVTELDVSDPTTPRVERTWTTSGSYVSARLVDGIARIVVRSNRAAALPFVYPSGPGAEESATRANRAVIESSTVSDWVSELTVTDASGNRTFRDTVAPCDQLYRPATFSGFGLVAVLTADLNRSGLGSGDGVAVLSSGDTVYASPTGLYVATQHWTGEDDQGATSSDAARSIGTARTDVHQFSISGQGPATYLASGSVQGRILNQFAMSEHDAHLRIAVTLGDWGPSTSNAVVILSRRADRLEEVGSVEGLGLGEQIYAVRFMGERAYVVTFRQIDPLYTLDLADPLRPRMLGELKIPGYSSYLHPVGENLLMGVGQDASEDGRVTGAQVSLFDVSNPDDPRRVDQLDLGEWTTSEVEQDHRAFLFRSDLAVVPFTSYPWMTDGTATTFSTGVVGVSVDVAAQTLSERARISHMDQPYAPIGRPAKETDPTWDHGPQAQIRRSVVIGDTLLTVSDLGVLASDVTTFQTRGWLSFR